MDILLPYDGFSHLYPLSVYLKADLSNEVVSEKRFDDRSSPRLARRSIKDHLSAMIGREPTPGERLSLWIILKVQPLWNTLLGRGQFPPGPEPQLITCQEADFGFLADSSQAAAD
jgi:hypothetical protein